MANQITDSSSRGVFFLSKASYLGATEVLNCKSCSADEAVEGAVAKRQGRGIRSDLQAKMRLLQAGMKHLQQSGGDPSKIAQLMKNFEPLMRQQMLKEAEALLDEALKLLE